MKTLPFRKHLSANPLAQDLYLWLLFLLQFSVREEHQVEEVSDKIITSLTLDVEVRIVIITQMQFLKYF